MSLLLLNNQTSTGGGTEPLPPIDDPWDVNDGLVIGELPYKLKGVNLAPSFTIEGMTIGWERMFDPEMWNVVWPTYIQPNIIRAKFELGVNCIRLIGPPAQFFRTTAIDSVYLEQYADFIEFCRVYNIYVYATGSGWGGWAEDGESYQEFPGITDQQVIDRLIEFALFCNDKVNVIGIDLWQELSSWGYVVAPLRTELENVTFCWEVITQCKTAGVTKPLTCSVGPTDGWSGMFSNTFTADIVGIVDYLDFHVYYPLYNITDMNTAISYGKTIIWGETAIAKQGDMAWVTEEYPTGQRNSFINALQEHVLNPNLEGFLFWCLAEDEPYPGPHPMAWRFPWGFYDNLGTPASEDDIEDFAAIPIPETDL